jgi:hypothetical protein
MRVRSLYVEITDRQGGVAGQEEGGDEPAPVTSFLLEADG